MRLSYGEGKIHTINMSDDKVKPLELFKETYKRCVDVNPRSNGQNNNYNQGTNHGDYVKVAKKSYGRKSGYKMTPHNEHYPLFKMIMDMVKMLERKDCVLKHQQVMFEEVMTIGAGKKCKRELENTTAKLTPKNSNPTTPPRGIASIPAVEHRGKKKRLSPHGSPSKYRS